MDPIIRAAVVSPVPRQLRGASTRVQAVAATPVAAQIAQHVLSGAAAPKAAAMAAPVAVPAVAAPVAAPVNDEAARAHADALKDLAAQQAQLLAARKKLDSDAAAVLADAERRGLERGQEKGEREALAQVARKLAVLSTLADALESTRQEAWSQAEDMLVEVVYAAVCRVAGASAASREALLEMVRGIARDEHAMQQWSVRLHPQDAELLLADRASLDERIMLQGDEAVVLGGCMVDSDKGTLDLRLETQLARLGEALLAARRARTAP